jgi:hypothetical protein
MAYCIVHEVDHRGEQTLTYEVERTDGHGKRRTLRIGPMCNEVAMATGLTTRDPIVFDDDEWRCSTCSTPHTEDEPHEDDDEREPEGWREGQPEFNGAFG